MKNKFKKITFGGLFIALIIGVLHLISIMDYMDCKPWEKDAECPWNEPTKMIIEDTSGEVKIVLVAAYLAELGYLTNDFKEAHLEEVQVALKLFQLDLKVPPTGQMNSRTWEKLQMVRLSHRTLDKLVSP